MEFEPYFVKAIKLLHSRHPDSADQLKQMLQDVLVHKKIKSEPAKTDEEREYRHSKTNSHKRESSDLKKRDAERKSSKLKQEPTEPEYKKIKSESSSNKASLSEHRSEKERDSSKLKEKDKLKDHKIKDRHEKEKDKDRDTEKKIDTVKSKIFSSSDDSSDESETDHIQAKLDTDNFAIDLGIACVVCKQFDARTGNQLVECQECHGLYHQECHKPPVTEKEVKDPRFVWYCSKCIKNMKKVVTKPHKTKTSTPSFKDPVPESTFLKPAKPSEGSSLLQPFKRPEASKTNSGKDNAKPFVGLAGLAANLSHKSDSKSSSSNHKSSSGAKLDPSKSGLAALASANAASSKPSKSSSHSNSSNSSSTKSSTSMGTAEKRMQMMKKKAVAKQQDKKNAYK